MLVITGMGRSGTSVLASLCKRLGFDPGGAYTEGINAGLEDPEVVAVNEDVLRPGVDPRVAAERTAGRIRAVRSAVVKDPRFILARGTALRVWWEQRRDLRVLLTVRDPSEVVRSRQAHPDWFGPAANETADVLDEDAAATVRLMTDLGVPFRCLRFPDFLEQPEQVFDALRAGGLVFRDRRAQAQWRRLVDFSKVRHSPRWAGTHRPPPPRGWRSLLGFLRRGAAPTPLAP